ncbi:GntG family PLP-dependent aldolase [Burkholderia gladioli]|uniref:GntG family PLP-dependent aldolase n=1 Tax=Burkholderia gladioli TaxID=28095 RepID=UPI001FC7CD75|nr:GntG family PLP-dependent aldolase [Burkholderia gladioli]
MDRPLIDFLSDTVTVPTAPMRRAMFEAEVGDDCYGEDPTVNELEALAAHMTGKAAAAFVSSGTLGNLTALLAQCPRGHEVILGDQSDLYNYEAGGISLVGGGVLHPVATAADGSLPIEALRAAIRDRHDYQCAPAAVIALENPHCLAGGRVLSLDYLRRVRELADQHGLAVHMDGARLFNAAVALGVPAAEIVSYADSVQFCLSKSLAAPYGSMVCGSAELIDRVKRYRKLLGGGTRQAGIMAAAGLVALTEMVERLGEDHRRAARLAAGLARIAGIALRAPAFDTSMVFFDVAVPGNAAFLDALREQGIRMGLLGDGVIRAVVHYQIDDAAIDATIAAAGAILAEAALPEAMESHR